MIDVPETRYASSTGGAKIAYQTVGDGPRDIVYAMSVVSNIEVAWENPTIARFFGRLASLGRLILFDKRGAGASDATVGPATLEHRLDDLRAVLDAVGSEDTVLFGSSEGGATCATFAATYPDHTRALVLYSSAVVSMRDEECPWAWTPEIFDAIDASIEANWATGEALGLMNPSVGDDESERAGTPGTGGCRRARPGRRRCSGSTSKSTSVPCWPRSRCRHSSCIAPMRSG